MIKLNKSPIRTSENYGMNDIEIAKELLVNTKNNNPKFSCRNLKADSILSSQFFVKHNICEEASNKNADLNLEFKIANTTNEIGYLTINLDEDLVENLNFVVEKNVKTKLVITIKSNKNCYNNTCLHFKCEENSNVELIILNYLNLAKINLFNVEADLFKNSKFYLTFIDFCSKNSINRIQTNQLEENSEAIIKTLYFANKDCVADYNIIQEIVAPNCLAENHTIGAIQFNAQKSYKGTISFKRGSIKSVGKESENCLLLSKNCSSKALPIILCEEDDVDGSHSTSVGKVNEKELFYLMSRGITKKEAVKLFVLARFNSILKNLFDENLKSEIIKKLEKEIVYEEL